MRRRLPWICLALAFLAGGILHVHRAANPTASYQSADERSYGKLGYLLAEDGRYGNRTFIDPLHWPPGYPVVLAVAHRLAGEERAAETYDIRAGYYAQAVVALLTALVVFLLARGLAGPWPGVAAAGLFLLYPPAILQTGEQVSEPLGALVLALFALALLRASRSSAVAWYGVAGVALGAVALVRADYVLLPIGMAVAVALALRAWREPRVALPRAAALGAGAVIAIAPWSVYASLRADELVPVTRGGGAALFVGTYLPGDGRTVGMKRALGAEVRAARPRLRGIPDFELPAAEVLNHVARTRHPGLDRNRALQREGRINLVRYGLGDPIDFGAMMLDKAWRMWSKYARGGARHTSPVFRGWHILLVLGCAVGLALGLRRTRDGVLAAIALTLAYATALHMIVVAQARYNAPLMPLLIAGGVAGWALWRRGRRQAPDAVTQTTRPAQETAVVTPA